MNCQKDNKEAITCIECKDFELCGIKEAMHYRGCAKFKKQLEEK